MKVCSSLLLLVGNTMYENAGTLAWWICVRAESSIMYLLLVTVVSVAVRILVIFVRKNVGV